MSFNKVTIIGVGLIGGSIGLAAKQKKIAKEITGVCRHRESLRRARQIGAIDKGVLDYKSAVKEADLVILAAPIKQIVRLGSQIAPYFKSGCLITDVGSTKEEIVREVERVMPEGAFFVGAHPLAGSEKRGARHARADLFKGTMCILTQSRNTNLTALKRIGTFWKKIGCRIVKLSPETHDKLVSIISHLPHLAAVQLVKVGRKNLDFAASGFLDTTRIASSDAEIWTDIFLTNKKFVTQAVDKYIDQLKLIRDLIRKEDRKRLSAEFKRAKVLRDGCEK